MQLRTPRSQSGPQAAVQGALQSWSWGAQVRSSSLIRSHLHVYVHIYVYIPYQICYVRSVRTYMYISDLLCAHIHMRVCTCACAHVQICTHVYVDLIFVSRVGAHKRILAPFPLSISLFPPAPVLAPPLSLPLWFPHVRPRSWHSYLTRPSPSTNAPSSPPFREPRFGGTPTPPEHALTRAHAHAHTHTRTHVHDHRRS